MATIARLILVILILAGLAAAIYFLWQRQPKAKVAPEAPQVQTIVKGDEAEQEAEQPTFLKSPMADEIQVSPDIRISGKVKEAGNVLIFSNSTQSLVSTQQDGTFETVVKIPTGLSIFSIVSLNTKYEELQKISLPVYLPKTTDDKAINFKSGTVKKIFNNTITVSLTDSTEQDIKTDPSTVYKILTGPSLNPTNALEKDIRVGDYLVAIGQNQNKILSATNIEIYRDNKPSLNKSFVIATIQTPIKNNVFSATDVQNKNQQYTIDKNTQIFENGNKVAISSIKKDKRAVIIYTEVENKINASYIQLL